MPEVDDLKRRIQELEQQVLLKTENQAYQEKSGIAGQGSH